MEKKNIIHAYIKTVNYDLTSHQKQKALLKCWKKVNSVSCHFFSKLYWIF